MAEASSGLQTLPALGMHSQYRPAISLCKSTMALCVREDMVMIWMGHPNAPSNISQNCHKLWSPSNPVYSMVLPYTWCMVLSVVLLCNWSIVLIMVLLQCRTCSSAWCSYMQGTWSSAWCSCVPPLEESSAPMWPLTEEVW